MDSSITWRVFIAEVPTKHSWEQEIKQLKQALQPFS